MIRLATKNDVPKIQELARITWFHTYPGIISLEQIEYMLAEMYSTEKIIQAIEKENYDFLVFEKESHLLGFCSLEHLYQNQNTTRIHKLYVHPEAQGNKFGQQLLDESSRLALENNSEILHLNVNKYNSAAQFYQRKGFEILYDEILDIGNGYIMDDFVMTKKI